MKLDNFNDFLRVYRIAINDELQRQQSSLKILEKNLNEFIKKLFSSTLKDSEISMLISKLNVNHEVFKKNLSCTEKFTIDKNKLKESINTEYKIEDIDDDLDDGDVALKFIQDKAKESATKKFKPSPVNQQPMTNQSAIGIINKLNANNNNQSTPKNGDIIACFDLKNHAVDVFKTCLEAPSDVIPSFEYSPETCEPENDHDITNVVNYLEYFLQQHNQTELTTEQKNKVSITNAWRGIINHIEDFRAAVKNKMPVNQLFNFLYKCINEGKLGTLTEQEAKELEEFLGNVDSKDYFTHEFDLKGKSLYLTNHMVVALQKRGYQVYYHYNSSNTNRHDGTDQLTLNAIPHLLEKYMFDYAEKSIFISKYMYDIQYVRALKYSKAPLIQFFTNIPAQQLNNVGFGVVPANRSLNVIQAILQGQNSTFTDHPENVDQLKAIISHIENVLAGRNENERDLTVTEKTNLSRLSVSWNKIVDNLDTLRNAVKENISPVLLALMLDRVLNGSNVEYEGTNNSI